jgi:hypothetical protein
MTTSTWFLIKPVLIYFVEFRVNFVLFFLSIKLSLFPLYIMAGVKVKSITTKVVSSNLAHREIYSIQLYAIKFVSDLWQVGGFLRFPPPKKLTARYKWNIVARGVVP